MRVNKRARGWVGFCTGVQYPSGIRAASKTWVTEHLFLASVLEEGEHLCRVVLKFYPPPIPLLNRPNEQSSNRETQLHDFQPIFHSNMTFKLDLMA